MLAEHADEALEAAEDRPVNDDRIVFGVIGANVFQTESLRELVIELDCGALPLAADGSGDIEIDLRSVEGAIALIHRVWPPRALERAAELRLRVVPGLDLSEKLRRTRRQLHLVGEP